MSDPTFEPNYADDERLDSSEADAADMLEQRRADLSHTPEDVDEGAPSHGTGEEDDVELDESDEFAPEEPEGEYPE